MIKTSITESLLLELGFRLTESGYYFLEGENSDFAVYEMDENLFPNHTIYDFELEGVLKFPYLLKIINKKGFQSIVLENIEELQQFYFIINNKQLKIKQ